MLLFVIGLFFSSVVNPCGKYTSNVLKKNKTMNCEIWRKRSVSFNVNVKINQIGATYLKRVELKIKLCILNIKRWVLKGIKYHVQSVFMISILQLENYYIWWNEIEITMFYCAFTDIKKYVMNMILHYSCFFLIHHQIIYHN